MSHPDTDAKQDTSCVVLEVSEILEASSQSLSSNEIGTDTPEETGEERGEGQEGHPDPSFTPVERPGAAIAGDQDSTATLPGAPPRVRAAPS
ncbi:hypothetical protein LEMLEM_LOCUS15366 [Lemmus lemmus]